jgi:hypothetical protein
MFMVDFKKEIAQKLRFVKIDKNWHLESFEEIEMPDVPDFEFIEFMLNFSKDSIFQINHIDFPLSESFVDAELDYEVQNGSIKLSEWNFWKLTDEINGLMLLSNIEKENKYRNIFLSGIENGIWIKYTFKKFDNNWKLIRIEDYST